MRLGLGNIDYVENCIVSALRSCIYSESWDLTVVHLRQSVRRLLDFFLSFKVKFLFLFINYLLIILKNVIDKRVNCKSTPFWSYCLYFTIFFWCFCVKRWFYPCGTLSILQNEVNSDITTDMKSCLFLCYRLFTDLRNFLLFFSLSLYEYDIDFFYLNGKSIMPILRFSTEITKGTFGVFVKN